jgi:hypothetical protein
MKRVTAMILFSAAAVTLAACGGGPEFTAGGRELPTPDEPGVYILTSGGDLSRIDGSPDWERKTWPERAEFSPDAELIVHDPAIARGSGEEIDLWRVAWLRSELQPTGQAAPVDGSQWVVANLEELRVPFVVTPHPEIPGIVHLDPGDRLEPGLYELQVAPPGVERRQGRFGVMWNSLDRRDYSAAHCVDRTPGGETGFRPCTASHAEPVQEAYAAASSMRQAVAPPLRIEALDTARQDGGLQIRGTLRNTSNQVQRVPMLRATVFDNSDRPTDSWVFAPPRDRIAPRGRISFTAWQPVAPGAARLDVDFVSANERTGLQ